MSARRFSPWSLEEQAAAPRNNRVEKMFFQNNKAAGGHASIAQRIFRGSHSPKISVIKLPQPLDFV